MKDERIAGGNAFISFIRDNFLPLVSISGWQVRTRGRALAVPAPCRPIPRKALQRYAQHARGLTEDVPRSSDPGESGSHVLRGSEPSVVA